MKKLEKQKKLSLTCDFWSSFLDIESKSFLGVTASYVDDKFVKHDICLNCKIFEKDHDAISIA